MPTKLFALLAATVLVLLTGAATTETARADGASRSDPTRPIPADELAGVRLDVAAVAVEQDAARYPGQSGGQKIETGRLVVYLTVPQRELEATVRSDARVDAATTTFRPASNSWSALLRVQRRVELDVADWADQGVRLTRFGPDVESNRVVAYLAHFDAQQANALVARYGAASFAVSDVEEPPAEPLNRLNDTSPYYTGDLWTFNSSAGAHICTNGFTLRFSGTEYMTSAGHCTTGNNYAVKDGYGTVAGYTYQRSLCNFCMDSVLVGMNTLPDVWCCGPSTTTVRAVKSAYSFDVVGDLFCTGGASTNNETCGVPVSNVNQDKLYTDNIWRTDQTVGQKTGTQIVTGGDSGGPTYSRINSAGDAGARGEITGGNLAGDKVFYQPISDLAAHYGMSIELSP